jgi:hypothetical protein
MRVLRSPLGASLLAALACAAPPAEPPLGSSLNPVRAATFLGEFEYLTRLQCPDGTRPHVKRLPTPRTKGPSGRMVNGYLVRCIYLNREARIYLDPYHPTHVEREPVPGFAFWRAPDPRRLFWLEQPDAGAQRPTSGASSEESP